MYEDQPSPEPVPPMHSFGMIDEGPPRTKWPMVLGTISIILAGFGLLCYGCNSASTIMQPMFMGMMPEDQRPATAQGAQLVIQIVQICALFLLSVWLLIAGIGLCRRSPWSRSWALGWCWAKILLSLCGTAVGFIFVDDMVRQINDQFQQQGSNFPFTISRGIMIALFAVGLVWSLIWPVIMLLWLTRGSIREEVANWGQWNRQAI